MYFSFDKNGRRIYSILLVIALVTSILYVSFQSLRSTNGQADASISSTSNNNNTIAAAAATISATTTTSTSTINTTSTSTSTGKLRTYYIAADEIPWNYAPFDKNMITGKPFDKTANVYVQNSTDRIGKIYLKAVYREYTDGNFTHLKPIPPQWQHLGILGPVIHAEVGDTIKVVFKNNAHYPFSIHPHGVLYSKSFEGADYNDGSSTSRNIGNLSTNHTPNKSSNANVFTITANAVDSSDGGAVPPGKIFTYIWQVPERAGPGPNDPSSILWSYHSHVNEVADTNAGLVGPIIITRHGEANPDGTPKGVDREFVTLFTIFNENKSPYLDQNIKKYIGNSTAVNNTQDDEFIESNLKHSINGFVYGNLQGLNVKQGEHVRWYVMGMGTETDLHTPHWHGQTLLMNGLRTDMVELLPMSMKTLDMILDNKGTWLFHCHVNDHIEAGMLALFTVT